MPAVYYNVATVFLLILITADATEWAPRIGPCFPSCLLGICTRTSMLCPGAGTHCKGLWLPLWKMGSTRSIPEMSRLQFEGGAMQGPRSQKEALGAAAETTARDSR